MDQSPHRPDDMAGYLDFLMHRRRVESSNTMLQYFGFREDPFRVNPDARYLFPSRTHLQALSALENGFYNNRGFIAMIAPPGMGKTTLLYRFLEDTRDTARSIFIFDIDAECKPRDFVGYILRDFGITPAHSSSEMHKQLSDALIQETEAGRKCVVVIDEAQNLSDAVLERVRLLTNFENSQGKLLQIILSGQPQLIDKLKNESLVQLRQRVSTICHLNLLTADETKDYIGYRLAQAGYEGETLFTEDAIDLIAEVGGGTPRTINNLCFNTLAMCSELQCRQADREMVAKVATSMGLDLPTNTPGDEVLSGLHQATTHWWQAANGEVRVWVPALIGVLVFAALIAMRITGLEGAQSGKAHLERIPTPPAIAIPQSTAVAVNEPPSVIKSDSMPQPTQPHSLVTDHHSGRNASVGPEERMGAQSKPAPKQLGKSTAANAYLTIDSNPVGAEIVIDGAFAGNAPSMVTLAPGPHQISVGKKGYATWHRTLSITGGRIHLDAELEQLAAGQ